MSLQDLIATKTADEMLEQQLVIAQSEGLATTSWQSGSVIRTIIVIMANMFAIFSGIIVEPIRGGFGDLVSSLDWAILWAKQTFDVDHVGAEAATGVVNAINPTTTQHDHDAFELTFAHATTGKTYRNTLPVSILAGATTPIDVAADEVGTGSNAAPGTITKLVTPSIDGVTFTNPLSVLGADDETVDALVARSRSKLAALSPDGPKDAYNYVAKSPEFSPTSTPITRASTVADPLTGNVTVYVATATGAPTAPDVAVVQTGLDRWAEPWCTEATAVGAVNLVVAVNYQVWVKSSLLEADIKTAIATALATYFSAIDIGGSLLDANPGSVYRDRLLVVVSGAKVGASAIGAVQVAVTLPGSDIDTDSDGVLDAVIVAPNQVPVLGTVTGTVTYL